MFFSESYGNYFYSDKIIWLNLIQKIKFLEKILLWCTQVEKQCQHFPTSLEEIPYPSVGPGMCGKI